VATASLSPKLAQRTFWKHCHDSWQMGMWNEMSAFRKKILKENNNNNKPTHSVLWENVKFYSPT
jgi:hypothetical protein